MKVERIRSGDVYEHSITITSLYMERQPQYHIRETITGQRDSPTQRWLIPAVLPDSDAHACQLSTVTLDTMLDAHQFTDVLLLKATASFFLTNISGIAMLNSASNRSDLPLVKQDLRRKREGSSERKRLCMVTHSRPALHTHHVAWAPALQQVLPGGSCRTGTFYGQ